MAGSSRKVILAALVGNTLVAITKFTAAAFTGSSAMFSEGVHSLVDTGNQVLLLYGMRRASRPADADFPFGHGKEIYFWSFVVAILIFALGAGISIYEGIEHIRDPRVIENPLVNYVVLVLAILFEGGAWWFALTEFRKAKGRRGYLEAVHRSKDPRLFVVLFEDSAAMLGLTTALIGIWYAQHTGNPVWDGVASIVIGCILAATAVWLAYETKGLLIGESASRRVVQGIRDILAARSEIVHINEIATMHMGPGYVLAVISVDFADELDSSAVEQAVQALNQEIKAAWPEVKRVFIEAMPRGFRRGGLNSDPLPRGSGAAAGPDS